MTDVIDAAQLREEMDRDIALEAQRQRTAEAFAPRAPGDANWCVDCDGQIEPERLRVLGATARCAACAHEFARRHGRA